MLELTVVVIYLYLTSLDFEGWANFSKEEQWKTDLKKNNCKYPSFRGGRNQGAKGSDRSSRTIKSRWRAAINEAAPRRVIEGKGLAGR